MKKVQIVVASLFATLGMVSQAFAVGTDFSGITSAVDWSTVGLAIVAIAALKAVPKVVAVGSSMVLRMIGR